jgi:beta-glucosidase
MRAFTSADPFLWGAATSAHQIEGYNSASDWWHWESQGRIEGGVRSGPATDHWNRRDADLDIAKRLHLNSYRFSIEWAKVEPEPGVWDESAWAWYSELLESCAKRGLIPMATLHHFTLPQWVADRGGFTNAETVERFLRFVREAVIRLGSRIPYWCTLNEPLVLVLGGYLGKFMPPAVYDPKGAGLALSNLLRAHVGAYDLIHRLRTRAEGLYAHLPLQVGLAHNFLDFKAHRRFHPIDQLLSGRLRSFYNDAWVRAVLGEDPGFHVPFLLPRGPEVPEARGRRSIDFLGVNYYTKAYVEWRPKQSGNETSPDLPIGVTFARRKESQSDLGWAIHPEGMLRILVSLKSTGLPLIITENGIADREDRHREEYLRLHLKAIAQARSQGVDVRGYYVWSLLDNFEWIKGFWPRFGLAQVDYESFERKLQPSALCFRAWIQKHGGFAPPSLDVFSDSH